jgi:hypothetical protein
VADAAASESGSLFLCHNQRLESLQPIVGSVFKDSAALSQPNQVLRYLPIRYSGTSNYQYHRIVRGEWVAHTPIVKVSLGSRARFCVPKRLVPAPEWGLSNKFYRS